MEHCDFSQCLFPYFVASIVYGTCWYVYMWLWNIAVFCHCLVSTEKMDAAIWCRHIRQVIWTMFFFLYYH